MINKLEAIKARLEAATPGPLEVVRFDNEDGAISYQLETQISKQGHGILAWYNDLDNPKAKADCTLAANAPSDFALLLKLYEIQSAALEACTGGDLASGEGIYKAEIAREAINQAAALIRTEGE